MPLPNCEIHERILKKNCKGLLTMIGQQKMISRTSKTSVSSFWEYIFLQKLNIGRKNTSIQWLIFLRKIQPWNYYYNRKETLII